MKPDYTVHTKFDIVAGSKNAMLPLRYHTHYRQFVCVLSGKIHVKMTPWKSAKYLYPIKDYENYDFRSPVHAWKPQSEYESEFNKIKFIEFDVHAGYVLYIPSYWWYSIKFSNESDNLVSTLTYDSVMNCITNAPNYALFYMQHANIQKRVTKTLDVSQHTDAQKVEEIEEVEELEKKE
jgi:hypothetical protein